MKKKFASFLLTGKAATLPFYASSSLAASHMGHWEPMAKDDIHLVQPGGHGIDMLDDVNEGIGARINMPGTGCTDAPPSVMNLVLTGLRAGDAVFLFSADDSGGFEDIDPNFKIGMGNLSTLANFIVESPFDMGDVFDGTFPHGGADLEDAIHTISVPVDLGQLPNPNGFHLQAVVIRGEEMKTSELDFVERVTKDCDSYGGGDGYGGGGGGGY